MFWLEPGALSSTTSNIIYLCRPLIKYIKIIAGVYLSYCVFQPMTFLPDQIKRHTRESQKYSYTLLLVPRTSTLATRILEEEGVLGDVTILPYNLQFIPLAEDVISLENDSAFKEIWVVRALSPHLVLSRIYFTHRTVMKRLSMTPRKLWPRSRRYTASFLA